MADIDIFETREMIQPLNTMFTPRSFLLNTFFTEPPQIHDAEAIDIDIYKGKRRLAPFVSPRSQGRALKREGRTTRTYKPPYVKPFRSCDAESILKRGLGQTSYFPGTTPMDRAMDELGKDLVELTESIERREEWMASKGLFTGVVPVKGEIDEGDDAAVVDDEIDFQMSASHKVTLAGNARWTQNTHADSVLATNLRDWKRLISQDSGKTARVLVLGANVVDPFLDHPQIKDRLNNRRIETGQLNIDELEDGVTYMGFLSDPGVDIYTYDEWYIDDDGNTQPMVPVDQVLLGATNAKAIRHYGPIKDLDAIDSGMVATRYFPKSWKEKNPSVRYVMVQSAPIVVPHEIDAFLTATVI